VHHVGSFVWSLSGCYVIKIIGDVRSDDSYVAMIIRKSAVS